MPSKCFDFNVYKQTNVNIVIGSWQHYRYIIISSSSICTSGHHGKGDHKRLRQKIPFRNKLVMFTNKAFRNDVFVTKNDNFDETGPFFSKNNHFTLYFNHSLMHISPSPVTRVSIENSN